MSYLTLAKGIPAFSQAVISLWFRVPRASVITASNSKLDTGLEDFVMMQGIMPLVTFGVPQMSKSYDTLTHDVAAIHPYHPGEPASTTKYFANYYVAGPSYDVEPSYIGLSCNSDGTFQVEFNIQMDGFMSVGATGFVTTKMDIWSGADPSAPTNLSPGSGVVQLGINVGRASISDASYIDNRRPEFFTVRSSKSYEPDEWHHVLLSFDVGQPVSIGHPFASSSCRLWYAIDDIDYRGPEHLGPFRDDGDTLDANAILTGNAYRNSGVNTENPNSYLYQNTPVPLPSGNYGGGSIPSADAAMGIPSSVKYVGGIFRCEMAELQMWTGVTLNTDNESDRRAFVDEKGEPVDPIGTEEKPAKAVALLGKKPEILLHGSDDWKKGHNTGTIGIELDPEEQEVIKEDGQFTPTAKIEKFKPEPALKTAPPPPDPDDAGL